MGPRDRDARRGSIQRAVQLLMAERAVHEMAGYSILVQAAADAGVSVHETATRMLAGSDESVSADGRIVPVDGG